MRNKSLSFLLIYIFLFLSSNLFSQKDTLKTKLFVYPFLEYKFQGMNTFGAGIRFGVKRVKKNYQQSSLSVVSAFNIFTTNKTVYIPFHFGLSYYKYIYGPHNGLTLGVYGTNFQQFGNNDFVLTPDIGFTFSGFNFSYGYNINMDNQDLIYYSKHKVGIRIMY